MTRRRYRKRQWSEREKDRASWITPTELDQRLSDIAKSVGILGRLRKQEGNDTRREAMTVQLCDSAVRLFERSINVEPGSLQSITRTLSDGPNEARSMAALRLVERYLRSIANPSYEDSVFARLREQACMSWIREPDVHVHRFSEKLLRECKETEGKVDRTH